MHIIWSKKKLLYSHGISILIPCLVCALASYMEFPFLVFVALRMYCVVSGLFLCLHRWPYKSPVCVCVPKAKIHFCLYYFKILCSNATTNSRASTIPCIYGNAYTRMQKQRQQITICHCKWINILKYFLENCVLHWRGMSAWMAGMREQFVSLRLQMIRIFIYLLQVCAPDVSQVQPTAIPFTHITMACILDQTIHNNYLISNALHRPNDRTGTNRALAAMVGRTKLIIAEREIRIIG